jgi:hypothetical protein
MRPCRTFGHIGAESAVPVRWSMREMGQRRINPWFSPRFSPWTFAGDLVIANMQIGTVLWYRLGTPSSEAERSRMVVEKMTAVWNGAFEAQKAALRLACDVTLGKMSIGRAAVIPVELGAAATKPAPKALKASAKPLAKRKTPKRS